jgi:hypothetical protein
MEAEIQKRKEAQVAAIEATKASVRALIEAREKYRRFKLRKTREGWGRYGRGLRTLSQREVSLFRDIKSVLLEIKSAARLPPPEALAVDAAVAQQLAAAPPPVPQPAPVPRPVAPPPADPAPAPLPPEAPPPADPAPVPLPPEVPPPVDPAYVPDEEEEARE